MIRPWLAQLSRSVLTGTLAPLLFDPTNPRPAAAAAAEQRWRKTSKEVRCRRLEADGEPTLDGTSPTGGADGGRRRGQQRTLASKCTLLYWVDQQAGLGKSGFGDV